MKIVDPRDNINKYIEFISQLTPEQFALIPEKERRLMYLQLRHFEKIKSRNMMPFFIPNGAQEEFIRLVGESPRSKKYIFVNDSGNGVGKSCMVINIIGNLIWGKQNRWFNYPLFTYKWKYPKYVWFLSEHASFKNKLSKEIEKWFIKNRYDFVKSDKRFKSHLESDTGWVLDCLTYDQEVNKFESADVGLFIFDEPPPKVIYDACVSRARMGAIFIFAMTPLEHSAWIYDELVDNENQKKYVVEYNSPTEANCIEHGVRGRLSHKQIEFMASQWTEEQKEARLFGRPKHLSGKIYKTLHPEIHRHNILPENFKQSENKIYCIIDPHDRRPPAIIWCAININGKKYVIDEYPDDKSIPFDKLTSVPKKPDGTYYDYTDFAKIIKDKEIRNGWDGNKIIRIMDPRFGRTPVGAIGKSVQQIFAEIGKNINWNLYFITNIMGELEARHIEVKKLLGTDLDGTPNLKIGMNCYHLWYQMNRYGIKENTARKQDYDGLSERVAERYKDFCDCLGYFAMMTGFPINKPDIEINKNQIDKDAYEFIKNINTDWRTDWMLK